MPYSSIISISAGTKQKEDNAKRGHFQPEDGHPPSDGENAWPNRKEMVKGLIRFYDMDIVGTQEGFKHQLDDIVELDEYAYAGAGRDDGKDSGEHSAILYKKKTV